jgi:hypothetical protein
MAEDTQNMEVTPTSNTPTNDGDKTLRVTFNIRLTPKGEFAVAAGGPDPDTQVTLSLYLGPC